MHFNVSQLLKEPVGAVRRYDVSDFVQVGDAPNGQGNPPFVGVFGSVQMLRTDAGIWVSAEIVSHLDCVCSRCVVDMETPITMHIEEEFLPEIDILTGARINMPDPLADNFYIDQAHILDMSEAVRQYFDLNTPLNPICSDDCKGICLTCGVNRNDADCACDDFVPDPRWGALLQLAAASDRN